MKPEDETGELIEQLIETRNRLRALLIACSDDDLARASRNPAWSNGELLFHMALGFFILPILLPLVTVFGTISPRISRVFVNGLEQSTSVFNCLNAVAARFGGTILTRGKLLWVFDEVCRRIIRIVNTWGADRLSLSMPAPRRWDPSFEETMSVALFIRYAVYHFDQHARDLTIDTHSVLEMLCHRRHRLGLC